MPYLTAYYPSQCFVTISPGPLIGTSVSIPYGPTQGAVMYGVQQYNQMFANAPGFRYVAPRQGCPGYGDPPPVPNPQIPGAPPTPPAEGEEIPPAQEDPANPVTGPKPKKPPEDCGPPVTVDEPPTILPQPEPWPDFPGLPGFLGGGGGGGAGAAAGGDAGQGDVGDGQGYYRGEGLGGAIPRGSLDAFFKHGNGFREFGDTWFDQLAQPVVMGETIVAVMDAQGNPEYTTEPHFVVEQEFHRFAVKEFHEGYGRGGRVMHSPELQDYMVHGSQAKPDSRWPTGITPTKLVLLNSCLFAPEDLDTPDLAGTVREDGSVGDRAICELHIGVPLDDCNVANGWRVIHNADGTLNLQSTDGDGANDTKPLYINGSPISGGGAELGTTYTQPGHGFDVGTLVTYNGSAWVVADNQDDELAADALVTFVDGDNFTIQRAQTIVTLSGLTAGQYYWLGEGGVATTTKPGVGRYQQIAYKALSTTEALLMLGDSLLAADAEYLAIANNLSDLDDAVTARENLLIHRRRLSSDVSGTTTSLAQITGLTVPGETEGTYKIRCGLFVALNNVADQFRVALGGVYAVGLDIFNSVLLNGRVIIKAYDSGALIDVQSFDDTWDDGDLTVSPAASPFYIELEGTVKYDDLGTIGIVVSRVGTAGTGFTIQTGSWLTVEKMA